MTERQEYFQDLQNDFTNLGILWRTQPEVTSTDALVEVLDATKCIGSDLWGPTITLGSNMKTGLGKQVLDWCRMPGMAFQPETDKQRTCIEAEPMHIASLANADNPALLSPLVITCGSEPIAVMKPLGEKTVLSLTDEPARGLLQGTFATQNQLHQWIGKLGPRKGVYTLEVDQITNPFVPQRASAMLVPPQYRRPKDFSDTDNIYYNLQVNTYTSMEYIGQMVDRLLDSNPQSVTKSEFGPLFIANKRAVLV